MAIKPNDPASFTPAMKGYTGQGAFRFWCQTVLPLVYDDSLSYYELLNKVVHYLNNTISDVANMEENVGALHDAYEKLQGYVNDYFSTLDVQEEINNKLDAMANDGTLSALLAKIVGNQFPIVVESTSQMTDKAKLYVLASTGTLWYWNGSAWENTGVTYGQNDTAIVNYPHPINSEALAQQYWPTKDWNDIPMNRVFLIGYTLDDMVNAPYDRAMGVVLTYAQTNVANNAVQIFMPSEVHSTTPYVRFAFGPNLSWGAWHRLQEYVERGGLDSAVISAPYQVSNNTDTERYFPTKNWNDLPDNEIVVFGYAVPDAINAPPEKIGTVITFTETGHANNKMQVFVSYTNIMYCRVAYGDTLVWKDWARVSANIDNIDTAIVNYPHPINSEALAQQYWPTKDWNDIPMNRVFLIGYTLDNMVNAPYDRAMGVVLTYAQTNVANNAVQIFFSYRNELYVRNALGPTMPWSKWKSITLNETYYVGGANEPTLTELLLKIKDNTQPKTIYIRAGAYNILQEYRDNNIPTPPDDVIANDYFTYNAFLPPNTTLIGLGNVELQMIAEPNDITVGESHAWSPLNVRGGCNIENVTIRVKNARYCIHDDYHGKYPNTRHIYKNVTCIYEGRDDGYGYGCTLGFGWDNSSYYEYDGCIFINNMAGTNSPVLYGHDNGSITADINDSATIVCKNCVIASADEIAINTIRFQSLVNGQKDNKAYLENCYIKGGLQYYVYTGREYQNFEVTLIKSGQPTENEYNVKTNPYPTTIYN